MRLLRSYLTALLILVSLAAAGGAWLPQARMIPLDIPNSVEALPRLAELRASLPTPTAPAPPRCDVPRVDAVCTAVDFRSVPVERPDTLLIPEVVRSVDDWRPLVERYFEPEDADRALDIIGCESGGDPTATNPRSSASGLFQHLGSEWPERAARAGWAGSDVFDPVANIAVAAWLVRENGGWADWAASQHCW